MFSVNRNKWLREKFCYRVLGTLYNTQICATVNKLFYLMQLGGASVLNLYVILDS